MPRVGITPICARNENTKETSVTVMKVPSDIVTTSTDLSNIILRDSHGNNMNNMYQRQDPRSRDNNVITIHSEPSDIVLDNLLTTNAEEYLRDRQHFRRKSAMVEAYDSHTNTYPSRVFKKLATQELLPEEISPPSTYYMLSLISSFFFLPVGLYAMSQARKSGWANEIPDLKKARLYSRKAHRFASLAICYGIIFWFVLIMLLILS